MKRQIFILLTIGALLSAQPMSAAQGSGTQSGQNAQAVRQLESRNAELGKKLSQIPVPQGKNGDAGNAIRRHQIREQRQRIQDLLEKARAGQRIDPAEIEGVR